MKHSELLVEGQPTIYKKEDFPECESTVAPLGLIGVIKYKLKQAGDELIKENYKVDNYHFEGQDYKLVKYEIERCSDLLCDFSFKRNKEPLCYFICLGSSFVTLSETDLQKMNYKNPIFLNSFLHPYLSIGMIYKKEDFNQDEIECSLKCNRIYYDGPYRKRLLSAALEGSFEMQLELDSTDYFTKKRIEDTILEEDVSKAKVYLIMNYANGYCNIYKSIMRMPYIDGVIEDPLRIKGYKDGKENKLYYVHDLSHKPPHKLSEE